MTAKTPEQRITALEKMMHEQLIEQKTQNALVRLLLARTSMLRDAVPHVHFEGWDA